MEMEGVDEGWKEDEEAKRPWAERYVQAILYASCCRKGKRSIPRIGYRHHPYLCLANFCNILESFYSLQNYPLLCLPVERACVGNAFSSHPLDHQPHAVHRPYTNNRQPIRRRGGGDRKKRRKKKKIKVAKRVGKGKSTYCSSLVLFVLRLATFHRGTKRSRAFIELRMRHMKNL